jgi:hypothetical protein
MVLIGVIASGAKQSRFMHYDNEAYDRKPQCDEASLNGFCIFLDCFAPLAMTPEAMTHTAETILK